MIFYHVFPLGYCGAAERHDPWNPASSGSNPSLSQLTNDLSRIAELGFTALYLGPVFSSSSHGYDTADYFHVDARLGNDDDLTALVARAHELGLAVVLDGVFNHVGREFWAFRDVREKGRASNYVDWFRGLSFGQDNRFADGFVYEGWEGVEELVALNHENTDVQEHLLQAAEHWIDRYAVDGIRLDVAYSLPFWFLDQLGERVRARRPDFWLLGEVIHGNYPEFVVPGRLDSVTNYECYKGLWSSFNDRNLFEIAHSLERLFAEGGLLSDALARGRLPYNFADNHDVDRIASTLTEPDHLLPVLTLLFSMPCVPSVYYGSEYGIPGSKADGDTALRPGRDAVLEHASGSDRAAAIAAFVTQLCGIRGSHPVLGHGVYEPLLVRNTALAFSRRDGEHHLLVAVQTEAIPTQIELPDACVGSYRSLFDGQQVTVGADRLLNIPAHGSVILQRMDKASGPRSVRS